MNSTITSQAYIIPSSSDDNTIHPDTPETTLINRDRLRANPARWPKPCEVVIRYINNPLTSGLTGVGAIFGGAVASLTWQASIPHIFAGVATGGITGGACGTLAYRLISCLCNDLKRYIGQGRNRQHIKHNPATTASRIKASPAHQPSQDNQLREVRTNPAYLPPFKSENREK